MTIQVIEAVVNMKNHAKIYWCGGGTVKGWKGNYFHGAIQHKQITSDKP